MSASMTASGFGASSSTTTEEARSLLTLSVASSSSQMPRSRMGWRVGSSSYQLPSSLVKSSPSDRMTGHLKNCQCSSESGELVARSWDCARVREGSFTRSGAAGVPDRITVAGRAKAPP